MPSSPKRPPQLPGGRPALIPEHLRASQDRIYEAMMRGGGEPFGAPYTAGVASLMERLVLKLKQRSFFAFETLERPSPSEGLRANKFTRYGAAPFTGDPLRKRPK